MMNGINGSDSVKMLEENLCINKQTKNLKMIEMKNYKKNTFKKKNFLVMKKK